MAQTYLGFGNRVTPQSEPIPGSNQIANEAGGFGFPVDDWVRLERFLILGSEGGTYYVGERELTKQNAAVVERCLKADGERTVDTIVSISKSGRAPKNEPALFAFAVALSLADKPTRQYARDLLPEVARTGTHLLHFVAYVTQFRGWGRALRNAIKRWYLSKGGSEAAYQLVKYQSRDKWSHRDALRLSHPKATGSLNDVLHWSVKGWPGIGDDVPADEALRLIWAFESAKQKPEHGVVINMIRDHRLPREGVPTETLTEPLVWKALLDEPMPMTAMIRNLATMTRIGLLDNFGPATSQIISRLLDQEALRKARVHPVQILAALKTYEAGKGERGHNTWTPVRRVVDALDAAFYASFANVEPTGKRWMIGLDVSGSMGGTKVAGMPFMSCHEAQAAMALVTASVEQQYAVCAFDTSAYPLTISPRQRLDDVLKTVRAVGGGGTNCAIPIQAALDSKYPVDVFAIFTDSETWQGNIHPQQALDQYRRKSGIAAKMVVVAMAATSTSIGDSKDAGIMNICGFDTNAPALIADFARR